VLVLPPEAQSLAAPLLSNASSIMPMTRAETDAAGLWTRDIPEHTVPKPARDGCRWDTCSAWRSTKLLATQGARNALMPSPSLLKGPRKTSTQHVVGSATASRRPGFDGYSNAAGMPSEGRPGGVAIGVWPRGPVVCQKRPQNGSSDIVQMRGNARILACSWDFGSTVLGRTRARGPGAGFAQLCAAAAFVLETSFMACCTVHERSPP
jgi:hypothetical protein